MTVCEMQCVENDEGDEEGSRSMLESFRSSPEKCQIIIKSDILADSIEGIASTMFSRSDYTITYA